MKARLREIRGGRTGSVSVDPYVVGKDRLERMPPWWWTPGRSTSRTPDPKFVERLKKVDRRLDVGWNPEEGQWEIWYQTPTVTVEWCKGWRLLFPVNWSDQLDNRVFYELYQRDNEAFGSAVAWFDQVQSQIERDKALEDEAHADETAQVGKDYHDYTKIKVGMRGKSSGSKFSKHHSGG